MGLEGTSFGPYRVVRRLGGGGAGDVYLAEAAEGSATQGGPARVALKVIDGSPNDVAVRQLVREAEAAAGLGNPHIIPYYGLVETPSSVAVLMGYAPSGSLGDTLRAGDRVPLPLAPGVVARIVTQVASGLAPAHAVGLVHGDLKPNNLFVRTSPQGAPLAVVGDFGQGVLMRAAATLARGDAPTPEQAAWTARQLRWASPEQLDGPAQPASDQYALAAVAYYLLTGRPPLVGDATAMPALLAETPVAPPSRVNPALPSDADGVLLRALAKPPAARFHSIGAFAEALAAALAVPASRASAGGPGVTTLMSAMTGFTEDERSEGDHRDGRNAERSPRGGRHSTPPLVSMGDVTLPEDAPTGLRRVLALCAGIGVFALIATCVLSLFWSGGNLLRLPSALEGSSAPTSATPASGGSTTGPSPQAQTAQQQLAVATARSPVFSDSFTSNAAHWTTGAAASIHDGHLYLSNAAGQSPGLETTPALPRLSSVAMRAEVAITQGEASDFAGICFFASTNAKGKQTYMCGLASSDGRYELWSYAQQWSYVTGGYSSALKLGIGQVNTLAVLANAPQGTVTLFANGSYLTQVKIGANPSLAATEGVIVLNVGAQASFTNFAVYDAGT